SAASAVRIFSMVFLHQNGVLSLQSGGREPKRSVKATNKNKCGVGGTSARKELRNLGTKYVGSFSDVTNRRDLHENAAQIGTERGTRRVRGGHELLVHGVESSPVVDVRKIDVHRNDVRERRVGRLERTLHVRDHLSRLRF